LSFVPGVKVIYHEHDSPASMTRTATDKMSSSGLLSGIGPRLRWLARRAIARSAKACVLPQAERAALFAQELTTSKRPFVVPNCPRLEEITGPRRVNNKELVIYYHGNISPLYLPFTLIHAVAKLQREVRLTIVGYETISNRGYMAKLAKEAERAGVVDRC